MALEVSRRRIGSGDKAVEILDVEGRLDAPGGAMLRSSVQGVLKEGHSKIALNLSECIEINREMTGTFHSLSRACQRAGGDLVLFGATGDVLEYIKKFGDRALTKWYRDEGEAVVALGGEVERKIRDTVSEEQPVVCIIGTDKIFRGIFWKLGKMGGRPLVKFDSMESAMEYLSSHPVFMIIIDNNMNPHDIRNFMKTVMRTPGMKNAGVIVTGPPSTASNGRMLVEEGAESFVPFVFTGEEIASKLDVKKYFERLKEAYRRYEVKFRAKTGN